jgi:hypothetical protein
MVTLRHIKFVFQFDAYIYIKKERSLHTNSLSHRIICRVHKWMTSKVDPLQIPFDSIVALIPYISFCKGVAIFLTAVPLVAYRCDCVCTLQIVYISIRIVQAVMWQMLVVYS